MPDNARHAALVRLAGTVDVEVAQAHDLRVDVRPPRAEVLVELPLGERVRIDRVLVLPGDGEFGAGSVDRRGRRIDEGYRPFDAVMQDDFRIVVVRPQHVTAVPFRRHGARALVQDGPDVAERLAGTHAVVKVFLVQVIDEVAVGQVGGLVAVGQVVDDEDVNLARRVESSDDVAADEAGATGDDDHAGCFRIGAPTRRS